jgi:hypothetical protein
MSRFVHARRVDKDDLAVVAGDDPLDAVAGRLRLVRDGGYLFAHQMIEKCRFAGVRPPDKRNISTLVIRRRHT